MRIRTFLIIYAFLFLPLCMCSSSSTSQDYSRVIPATEKQINHIKEGLEEGFSISNEYAIKSNDFKKVNFVACNLNGPGVSDAVAVWAITGDPDEPGMIVCADHTAKEFSVYPLGSKTKAEISMADEGARIVEEYLRKKLYLK